MKYIFAALLCAVVLVSACDASCFLFRPKQSEHGGELKGCFYKEEWYELGSQFVKDCQKCSCFRNGGMQCCTDYSPECIKKFQPSNIEEEIAD